MNSIKLILKKISLLALFCAIISTAFTGRTATALTVSPFRLELAGDPGQTLTGTINLYNESTKAETYFIAFENFEARDESGRPYFIGHQDGLASWLRAPDSVTLKAQERFDLPFTLTIPSDIDPGGYAAAIFSNTAQFTSGNQNTSVAVEGQLGTLILLQVNGQFKEGADIIDFTTKGNKRFFNSLPIDFQYRFQNAGQSWVKPLGDITIKNTFGQISKIIGANSSGSNVLPRSIRRFEASWLQGPGPKTQAPDTPRPVPPEAFWNMVKYQWNNFALGPYRATLNLNYGSASSNLATASRIIWVLPWQLLSVIGIIFALLILERNRTAIFKKLRRRKK